MLTSSPRAPAGRRRHIAARSVGVGTVCCPSLWFSCVLVGGKLACRCCCLGRSAARRCQGSSCSASLSGSTCSLLGCVSSGPILCLRVLPGGTVAPPCATYLMFLPLFSYLVPPGPPVRLVALRVSRATSLIPSCDLRSANPSFLLVALAVGAGVPRPRRDRGGSRRMWSAGGCSRLPGWGGSARGGGGSVGSPRSGGRPLVPSGRAGSRWGLPLAERGRGARYFSLWFFNDSLVIPLSFLAPSVLPYHSPTPGLAEAVAGSNGGAKECSQNRDTQDPDRAEVNKGDTWAGEKEKMLRKGRWHDKGQQRMPINIQKAS